MNTFLKIKLRRKIRKLEMLSKLKMERRMIIFLLLKMKKNKFKIDLLLGEFLFYF
jgi:hypothetical protein